MASRLFIVLSLLLIPPVLAPARAQDPAGLATDQLKQLSLEQLLNTEVTSVSRTPERLFDAPAAIQVVSHDAIVSSGATSIPEALRLADNLEVAQINSHDWAISARGFNANLADKLLVLIDGRAVYNPLYGGVLWNVQDYPLEDLNRIEVISGPAGTQWGANAVNGVINIVTKNARDTQGWYVSEAAAGNLLQDQTEVRYGGTLQPNVFYRVYTEYSARGSELQSNGAGADDSWDMARGGFRVDANPDGPTSTTIQGDIYRGTEYLGATGDEGLYGGNVLGKWSADRGPAGTMSLLAYYDRTHLSLPYPAQAPANFFSGFPASALVDDLNTFDVDFQDRLGSQDGNYFLWGSSYRYTQEKDTDLNLVQFAPERENEALFTGFAEGEMDLAPDWHVTAGSKLEHNEYTGWELEPSIRGVHDLGPRQMIWAAVSRAVRTPSRYDRDLFVPTGLINPPAGYQFPAALLAGSHSFRSETELAYELGWRAELSSTVTASLSNFYNTYDHVRSVATTPTSATYPFPYPYVFENGLRAETYGTEVSLDVQPAPQWRLHAGYDYLHERIAIAPGQMDADGGRNEMADPRNQLFLRSDLKLPAGIDFNVAARWISKLIMTQSPTSGPATGTVPAYAECDVRLAWTLGRVELSLVGQNLLHRDHAEYGYPAAGGTELIQRTGYARAVWRY